MLWVVIAAVAAVVGGAAAGARAVTRSARSQTTLAPGVDLDVPRPWYGSHDPEARMFRRVRDALASIEQGANAGALSGQARLQASGLTRQLIAVSQLAAPHRQHHQNELEASVAAFEATAARAVMDTAAGPRTLSGELDELGRQLDLLEQARAEVEQIDRQHRGTQQFEI